MSQSDSSNTLSDIQKDSEKLKNILGSEVVVYIDVSNSDEQSSKGLADKIKKMGATVAKQWRKKSSVTHVVWKSANESRFKDAQKKELQIVTPEWVLQCLKKKKKLKESDYEAELDVITEEEKKAKRKAAKMTPKKREKKEKKRKREDDDEDEEEPAKKKRKKKKDEAAGDEKKKKKKTKKFKAPTLKKKKEDEEESDNDMEDEDSGDKKKKKVKKSPKKSPKKKKDKKKKDKDEKKKKKKTPKKSPKKKTPKKKTAQKDEMVLEPDSTDGETTAEETDWYKNQDDPAFWNSKKLYNKIASKTTKYTIEFSSIDEEQRVEYDAAIAKLEKSKKIEGGIKVSPEMFFLPSITHVVLGKEKRSLKVLYGMASGAEIVSEDWIKAVVKNVEEEKFELPKTDSYQVKRFQKGSDLQKERLKEMEETFGEKDGLKNLFSGKSFSFHQFDEIEERNLKLVIELLGGTHTQSIRRSDICVCNPTLTPNETCLSAVSTVSMKWLSDSIEKNESLDFDDYEVKRSDVTIRSSERKKPKKKTPKKQKKEKKEEEEDKEDENSDMDISED